MDEELYLHCLECGEAFDSLRPAFAHKCGDPDDMELGEPSFIISEEL